MNYGLIGLTLAMYMGFVTAFNEVIEKEWDNKLLKHHQILLKDLNNGENNLTDCWICTHSPVSATTMSYLAVPVSTEELMSSDCSWLTYLDDTIANHQWENVSVALNIVGYVTTPWWKVNLTTGYYRKGIKIPYVRLTHMGGRYGQYVKQKVTNLDVGEIEQPVPLSFQRANRCLAAHITPSCIARTLHDKNWPFNHLYPAGTDQECQRLEGSYKAIDTEDNNCLADIFIGGSGSSEQWCAMNDTLKLINVITAMSYGYTFKF